MAGPKDQEGSVGTWDWGFWEGFPQGVTSEWEKIRWTQGDAVTTPFRISGVGNFGSCQCPGWLTARCELKEEGRKAGNSPGIPSGPAEQLGLTISVSKTRSGLGELKGRGWVWGMGIRERLRQRSGGW